MCLERSERNDKNYELIEYLNDVNREHAEVLVEQNINGKTDTSYIYGAEINGGFDRISLDRFDGSTGYYLYDARGSVSGITNEEGQVYQSYRYSVTGEITFGAPQYENEYTYNGESYNPNIESQYLRARYYCVVTATFLTEDSYLGSQTEPLTLNRYNYCVSSYLNYTDPSGNDHYTTWQGIIAHKVLQEYFKSEYDYQIGYHPYTEYRVTGYANSKTGIGYADIVLRRPDGVGYGDYIPDEDYVEESDPGDTYYWYDGEGNVMYFDGSDSYYIGPDDVFYIDEAGRLMEY